MPLAPSRTRRKRSRSLHPSLFFLATVVVGFSVFRSDHALLFGDPLERTNRIGGNDTPLALPSKQGACEGYKGILKITRGDGDAAVGTMFFMYIVSHVLYAEQQNLLPWVHLDDSSPCFDRNEHGKPSDDKTWNNVLQGGFRVPQIVGTNDYACHRTKRDHPHPGNIEYFSDNTRGNETFRGNGVWETYFEPLVPFDYPNDPSCHDIPLIELHKRFVFPGLHYCAPWSVHAWPVRFLPRVYSVQANQTLLEWFAPMRARGAHVVSRYFRPLPWLRDLIEETHPSDSLCLAMHIRMTDKGHGRRKRPLETFQPYADAYTHATPDSHTIYVATDDARVLERIRQEWLPETAKRVRSQANTHRSQHDVAPIFKLFRNESHKTNTEGLIDMYAMSKCQFMVHGFSAMAEATMYLHHPQLHQHSVNVDDDRNMTSVDTFRNLVSTYYNNGP